MASKPRGERSSVREMKFPAALLTRPVSGPPSSQIACTMASTAAASRMSTVWHFTEPPCFAVSSAAVFSNGSRRLPQMHRSAPSSRYFAAISRPRPVPPPVTRMRLPLRRSFRNTGLDGQYDLADVRARFHQRVRFRRFGERKGLVDDRLDLSGLDERPDFFPQVLRDRAPELHRARAQGGAGDGEAAAQDVGQVERRLRAAEEGDDDDAAVVGEAFQLAVDGVARDHVEDHIDAAAGRRFLYRGDEILDLVVDSAVGAELHAGLAFFRAARRREHLVAEGFHDLDRGDADAGRAALHEEGFAGLDPGAIEDIAPDGEEGFGERGRLDRGHAFRDRQALRSGGGEVFGVAVALDGRAGHVADSPSRDAFG